MRAEKLMVVAKAVASLSKDPSTKVGAVAITEEGIILCVGFNGFPRGVFDDTIRYADRDTKLVLVAHAEQNLVAQAAYSGVALRGSTVLLSGMYPCSSCAKSLIQAGVVRILTPMPRENSSWSEDAEWSKVLFREAGVEIVYVEGTNEDSNIIHPPEKVS